MSSISDKGENEFVNGESNLVGKSEEAEEEMAEKTLKEARRKFLNQESKM